MKRKLMLLFSLFFLILPISGCGGDGDSSKPTYNVTVSLVGDETATGADSNFLLNDCAAVSGDGSYNQGDNVKISIKYVKKACKLNELQIISGDNKQVVTSQELTPKSGNIFDEITFYGLSNIQSNYEIKVIMTGLHTEVKSTRINFTGITRLYSDSLNGGVTAAEPLTASRVQIPYLNESGAMAPIFDKYENLVPGTSVSSILGGGKDLNLNYLYLDNKFQSYKLNWRKGNYNPDADGIKCSGFTDIVDISNFTVEYGDSLCISANLDETSTGTNLKSTALDNLNTSSAYIYNNSTHNCGTASDALTPVDENCMYVSNMSAIYNADVKGKGTSYAAITDNGRLEQISINIDKVEYYICGDSSIDSCSTSKANIKKISYTIDNYSILQINDFINLVKDESKDASMSNLANITLDYNSIVKDVVITQIKSGDDIYYINYVGDNTALTNYNSSENRITPKKGLVFSDLYEISIVDASDDVDASDEAKNLKALETKLNSDNNNRLFSTSTDIPDAIRLKIYEIINNEPILNTLRNYIYTIEVEDHTINISKEGAILSADIIKKIVQLKEYDVSKVCYKEDQECVSQDFKELIANVENYILVPNGLTNVGIKDIKKVGNTIEYQFIDENIGTIIYNSETNSFKKDGKLEFKYAVTEPKKPDSIELSIKIDNSGIFKGTVIQSTNNGTDIVTTINGNTVDESFIGTYIDTTTIGDLYKLIMDPESAEVGIHVYHDDGSDKYFLFYKEGDITKIAALKSNGDSLYTFTYNNNECEVKFSSPPAE